MPPQTQSEFFETILTVVEVRKYKNKIKSKIIQDHNCKIWQGQQRNGYGILEIRFRGNRKLKITVHRLVYYINHNCEKIPPSLHVSHLCHNKLCCEPSHLSLEPQRINNNRNICKRNGECSGHHGYSNCVI